MDGHPHEAFHLPSLMTLVVNRSQLMQPIVPARIAFQQSLQSQDRLDHFIFAAQGQIVLVWETASLSPPPCESVVELAAIFADSATQQKL